MYESLDLVSLLEKSRMFQKSNKIFLFSLLATHGKAQFTLLNHFKHSTINMKYENVGLKNSLFSNVFGY